LAEGPRLLLLDELTTFLDVEDQFGVLRAVRSITHQRSDVTAIWVTHR
jgi:ABC-type glutathione transport system ATPase component